MRSKKFRGNSEQLEKSKDTIGTVTGQQKCLGCIQGENS